jgi:hypothetical protein
MRVHARQARGAAGSATASDLAAAAGPGRGLADVDRRRRRGRRPRRPRPLGGDGERLRASVGRDTLGPLATAPSVDQVRRPPSPTRRRILRCDRSPPDPDWSRVRHSQGSQCRRRRDGFFHGTARLCSDVSRTPAGRPYGSRKGGSGGRLLRCRGEGQGVWFGVPSSAHITERPLRHALPTLGCEVPAQAAGVPLLERSLAGAAPVALGRGGR